MTLPRGDRTPEDAERRAFRAFVREHHPDRGGDPDVFKAGLAAYRRRGTGDGLRFHRQRRGLAVLTGWWQDRRERRTRPPRVR